MLACGRKGDGPGREGEMGREKDQKLLQAGLLLGPCPFPRSLLSSPRPHPLLRCLCFLSGASIATGSRGSQRTVSHPWSHGLESG